jgi:hypothetical protein
VHPRISNEHMKNKNSFTIKDSSKLKTNRSHNTKISGS